MNESSPYKIGDKVVFIDRQASTPDKTCMRLGEVVGGQAFRTVKNQDNGLGGGAGEPVQEVAWKYVIKAVNDAIFSDVDYKDLV